MSEKKTKATITVEGNSIELEASISEDGSIRLVATDEVMEYAGREVNVTFNEADTEAFKAVLIPTWKLNPEWTLTEGENHE